MADIGGITGRLKLAVGKAELDLGTVYLPLVVSRTQTSGNGTVALEIGVDLDEVREAVADPNLRPGYVRVSLVFEEIS